MQENKLSSKKTSSGRAGGLLGIETQNIATPGAVGGEGGSGDSQMRTRGNGNFTIYVAGVGGECSDIMLDRNNRAVLVVVDGRATGSQGGRCLGDRWRSLDSRD